MNPILFILLLVAIAIVLFIGETILPTHGLLGIAGIFCIGGAIFILFRINQWIGLGIFLAVIVASPLLASAAMRIWIKSPVGKRIILPPVQMNRAPPSITLGQIGVTATELRPAGECDFGELRIRATSQFGEIAAGEKVKVIAIDNGRPTVRPLET